MIAALLAQVIVILLAARVGGRVFRYMGQPEVVGEMTAGILLGQFASRWFGSTDALNTLSQIGLILFLFLVGLRLDSKHLAREGRLAAVTSAVSIGVPFVLGAGLGLLLYSRFANGAPLAGFALFLGTAMSVTAFPVLARILRERNMEGTRVGTVAIACAAIDDVAAWLILAGLLAFIHSSTGHTPFWQVLGLLMLYCLLVWFGLRKAIRHWTPEGLTRVLLIVFGSSLATEWIGIHAFFGAFVAGIAMPKTAFFTDSIARRIEPLTTGLLLPLFFTVTGLRARIDLVQGWWMWGVCAAIICVAVLGKWGGAAVAAHWMGMTWRDASALGILLNTRGLVELIVLKTGLDAGMISPALFSMMVLMAIATTAMTSPMLNFLKVREEAAGHSHAVQMPAREGRR